ncbi:ABC transporter permease [Nocardiopsis sp. MG754419]|uniref:ABC transporter permease n=1 Tax=Nocardiopsis sp. MG754419 TaxID=2259865 RepID=UPI001BA7B971|nr:ABC transporter permease [Nocardiopsis sp. MG754419]MBR8741846.1 hypothetical protein [Nocardiopsis sp. MG754419]
MVSEDKVSAGETGTGEAPPTDGAADQDTANQSWIKQVLHLSRVELLQLRRARITLLYLCGLPVLFAFISFSTQGLYSDSGDHVDAGAASLFSMIAPLAAAMGFLHVANLFAVRRDRHILKRLRVGGVTPSAVYAAATVPVLAFVLVLTLVLSGIGFAAAGQLPAAPGMLLVAVVLSSVNMTLLGIWFTRFTRSAEAVQLVALIPLMLLLFGSGSTLPLEFLSDTVARLAWFTPLAPLVDLFRSAYFGSDFFGGQVSQVEQLGTADLWMASLPAVGLSLLWLAVSCYLLRGLSWSSRSSE